VFSAFLLLGYAAFQIPAGWVVGKLGPRKTLTYGLIWWSALSVATALVPPNMTNALWVLIAVRFILGLGEAVAYPSSNQFIRRLVSHPGAWQGQWLGVRRRRFRFGLRTAAGRLHRLQLWLARSVLCVRRDRTGDGGRLVQVGARHAGPASRCYA